MSRAIPAPKTGYGRGKPGATPNRVVTLSGPSSGVVGVASADFTLGISGGALTGNLVVTPTSLGGTCVPATVTLTVGVPSGTFTFTPSSTGAKTLIITNSSAGVISNPSPWAYTSIPAAATALTWTYPSSGAIGVASADFTVTANGTLASAVVVSPSYGAGDGYFTPSTITLTSAVLSGTFTYTPATAGTKTISISNNGGLTNPAAIAFGVGGSTWGFYEPVTTFDTRFGLGVDSSGLTTLAKDASARYVYVRNGGNDSNSGLSHTQAKATLLAGFNALRHGYGDWLLVASGSSFAEGFIAVGTRSGISAAYPTVVTTYDGTGDASGLRAGTFTYATNPSDTVIDLSGANQYLYFENGRCAKPLATQSSPGTAHGVGGLSRSDGADQYWMFYNWTFTGCHLSFQGDYLADFDQTFNVTGNLTAGSPNMTGVSLVGGSTPVAGSVINGRGPTSGIPAHTTIVSWTPGTSTLVLSSNATENRTAQYANCHATKYYLMGLIFRRCVFAHAYSTGGGHSQGMYLGPVDGATIEDCVFYHNGYIGARNALADITMSANFTGTTGSGKALTTTGGTINCSATNGSPTLTGVTLTSGYLEAGNSITGTGVPGGTTVSSINSSISPNIYKHNAYFSTSTHNTIFRRNVSAHGSATGLQLRGGGQCSDNVFASNPINLSLGSGDNYNYARNTGVPISGGHNVIIGSADIDVGTARSFGITYRNTVTGNQSKTIICKYGGSGGPYNVQPFTATSLFDTQPTIVNFADSIVYDWPGSVSLSSWVGDTQNVPYPGQMTWNLTGNVSGGDSTWNSFGSGNVTSGAYPDPDRTIASYATANGYASEQALWDYMILHPEVNWAQSMATYFRAGFGV